MRRGWLFTLLLAANLAAADKLAIVDAFFEEPDGRITRNLVLNGGDTNYFSFKVAGFRADAKQKIQLAYTVECFDSRGTPIVEPLHGKEEGTLSPQDEHWQPKINWSAVVPTYAPSGTYLVKVHVEDQIAKADANHESSFKVRAENVAPEDKLAVRNFVFSDTDGGASKPNNNYRPGSTLWASFKLVGFRITKDKEYWVEHDLSVLDANGKVLFSNPNAAVEQHKQFYPPQVLTTSFNLDLQAGVKPGEYTIRLDARDRLGEQTATFETKFRVEP